MKHFAPDDPIYLYLAKWADVRKYDVIKRRTDTSSYTYVSTLIPGTENTPKHRQDARHRGRGQEEKIRLSLKGGPF